MNILTIANFKAGASGNFINSLIALGEAVRALSWEMVFMFPLRDDGTECSWTDYIRSYGFTVITYSEQLPADELAQTVFSLVDQYEIDLIHTHFSAMNNFLLWNKEIHKRVKILYHDHMDYIAEKPFFPQFKKQVKLARRYREYGIGVISVMKKKDRGYFLVPNKWYIPNGITYCRNVPRSLSREEERARLQLKECEKLCVFLGWDIYRKGLDIAIKATQEVRRRGYDLTLGVLGFGADPDATVLDRIGAVIGFDPQVEGVRFLETEEDMYAIHRASDVFLSASRTEAFSYAILEAISQNVPVVVSDISGTRWSLRYSKSVKFRSCNVKQCADALIKAMTMRDTPSNRDTITESYHIKIWTKRIINAYRDMCGEY